MHRKEQTLEVGWCQDESFITIDDQFSRRVNNGGKKVLFFSLVFSVGRLLSSDPMEDVCQQLYIARFISNTIGRGIARAEAEIEMEAQLQSKNFEIARLLERLHCYETMNREMSQRNQEAVGKIYVVFLSAIVLISHLSFFYL